MSDTIYTTTAVIKKKENKLKIVESRKRLLFSGR